MLTWWKRFVFITRTLFNRPVSASHISIHGVVFPRAHGASVSYWTEQGAQDSVDSVVQPKCELLSALLGENVAQAHVGMN